MLAGQPGQYFCRAGVKSSRGVQSGADGGPAQRQMRQLFGGRENLPPICLQHSAPAGYFLREGDGRGILQVRATGLDDAAVILLQANQLGDHAIHRREQAVQDSQPCRNVHGSGEGVIGGL